jgi:transducin (beta)-like 1
MLKITAEEVNFLVFRYLEENGYKHSAFAFKFESNLHKSCYNEAQVAPGKLLMFLEKGLLLLLMETHISKDEEDLILCNQSFSLLNPHICPNKNFLSNKTAMDDNAKRAPNFHIGSPRPDMHIGRPPLTTPNQNMYIRSPVVHTQGSLNKIAGAELNIGTNHKFETQLIPKVNTQLAPINSLHTPTKDSVMTDITHGNKEGEQTFSSNAALKNISIEDRKGMRLLSGHNGIVYYLAWHPQKLLLVTGGSDSTAKLWKLDYVDTSYGKELPQMIMPITLLHANEDTKINNDTKIDITSVNWCSVRSQLVTGATDGFARVWNEDGISIE